MSSVMLAAASGRRDSVLLQRTDDEKVAKERMHLDLKTNDVEAEVQRLAPAMDYLTYAGALPRNDSRKGRLIVQPSEIAEVLNRPISQELLARDLTRLAYVAKDGTPRNVPIGFVWNGSEIVMCTAKNAAKLPALRHNPAVALTIDTEVHPPKILLIRGRVGLDVVDGIPQEYLQMNGSYEMTPEQRVEWEAEVRSLYDGMVRIVVTPTWAKLIDFETTLPSAVAELVRQRDERQRS